MASLVDSEQGEEVWVMDTDSNADETFLVPKGKQEKIWRLKNGLGEDDDFVYISEPGWRRVAQE